MRKYVEHCPCACDSRSAPPPAPWKSASCERTAKPRPASVARRPRRQGARTVPRTREQPVGCTPPARKSGAVPAPPPSAARGLERVCMDAACPGQPRRKRGDGGGSQPPVNLLKPVCWRLGSLHATTRRSRPSVSGAGPPPSATCPCASSARGAPRRCPPAFRRRCA